MFRWLTLALCISLIQGVNAQSESFGRLSRIEGEVYVLKLGSVDWEYGEPNLLIEEGDIIRTGAHDFAEVELENGTLIRMDEVTEVRIRYLHKDLDNLQWRSGIDVLYGVIRVRTPELTRWSIELDAETPTGSIIIGEESLVKVIVRRSGASKVIAYGGDVVVAGEWDELYLNAGEAVWISSSGELERPSSICTIKEDRFDRWCEKYYYGHCGSRNYIHTDIYIGVHCLDTYGDWVWLVDCGWTWRPRVRRGWCPYRYGRWTWTMRFGWFWVSYEPWGWIPFHYGRWAYSPIYGWVWIPGSVWGPGWVAWSYGPGWIAWAPLGPGDDPALCGDGAYTTVSYDSFVSKSKPSRREKGYSQYLDVKIGKEKWSKKPPERILKDKEERFVRNRELKNPKQDERMARTLKEKNLKYSRSKKKVSKVVSRPTKLLENSEIIPREEHSAPKRKVYSRSRKKKVVRKEIRKPKEPRVRKSPVVHSDKKKPESDRKSKPRNENRDVRKRSSAGPNNRASQRRRK